MSRATESDSDEASCQREAADARGTGRYGGVLPWSGHRARGEPRSRQGRHFLLATLPLLLALWLAEAVLGAALLGVAGPAGHAALLAAVNLAVALRFALTLRPGRVPLVTRYAASDPSGLLPGVPAYARRLTALWAAGLAAAAALHALPPLGIGDTGTLLQAQGGAMALFFLGEHAVRARRFPLLGRVTPWRTLRAVIRSTRARHA